jgi:hypothetical protein
VSLHQWLNPEQNFDGLIEGVKEEYEVDPYLKRLHADAKEANLDFRELTG